LEGTFRGHLVQPFCSEQGHLQLDHVAQSPVQPSLEYSGLSSNADSVLILQGLISGCCFVLDYY